MRGPTYIGDTYAYGWESGNGLDNTGVSVQRYDINIAAGNPICNGNFTGNLVAQNQFVNFDPYNWIVMGTLHKSSSCKYWFSAYMANGFFTFITSNGPHGYAQHTFQIIRSGTGNSWQFYVDITKIWDWPIFLQYAGHSVQAGLESFSGGIVIGQTGFYSLKFNHAGPWYDWSGQDGILLQEPTTTEDELCGGWNSPTHFHAAENATC